ncbi:MAG: carbonic anhydrase [Alphaproteobacteria bacterium]
MDLINRFKEHRAAFYDTDGLIEYLAQNGQNPDHLIVTCMDSRISLYKLFGLEPGEALVMRSAGPLIPIFDENCSASQIFHENLSIAINDMQVRFISLMGHTGCGAAGKLSQNLYNSGDIPWMKKVSNAIMLESINAVGEDDQRALAAEIEKQIIIQGLRNILEYPAVRKAVYALKLNVEGLQFDVHNGRILKLNTSGQTSHFDVVAGPADLHSHECDHEGAHAGVKASAQSAANDIAKKQATTA